jgi:hypothetical protein
MKGLVVYENRGMANKWKIVNYYKRLIEIILS